MFPSPQCVSVLWCIATILSSAYSLRLHRAQHVDLWNQAAERDSKAKQDAYTESKLAQLLTPTVSNHSCGGFHKFGHYCEKNEQKEGNTENCQAAGAWCLNALEEGRAPQKKPVGLSFGVFNFDEWSKELSNEYSVSSELFDCFYTDKTHHIHDVYKMPYKRHDTCLSAEEHLDEKGRKFETLTQQLKGRDDLSTFVKIDIEGWEWQVLEDLINKHPQEMDKISLLDLELHFCQRMEKPGKHDDDTFSLHPIRQIPILEKLLKNFAVNYYAKSMWNCYNDNFKGCAGAPATMANVNLVNRKILQKWGQSM